MGDAKFWTEVCTSSEGLNTVPNAENLFVFDDSTVSLVRQIGEGGQGCIYDAKFYTPFSFKPYPVIVKKFKPLDGISQGHLPQKLFSAHGNYVCRPFGAVYKENSLCIIMKKYSADLRGHIDECMKDLQDEQSGYVGPPFADEIAVYIMVQLAMGLKSLNEWGIPHKDLKAANILVNRYRKPNGERYPGFDVTIADFETSESVVGTGFFRAPEVFQYLRTRVPLSEDQWMLADIYSFGMICYEVVTGKVPFDGHRPKDYDLVLDGGRPELPDHVPEFLKNIILRCWHADPNSRPCWTDIIQALMQNSDGGHDLVESPIRTRDYLAGGHDLVENPIRTMDYLISLESSGAGSSVESMIMELKEKIEIHREELERIEATGFVDHIYWASEFVATAEKYASKFDVESNPHEHLPLLCSLPEFLERFQLFGLLRHQVFGCGYAVHACKCQQNMDDHMNVEVKSSSVVFMIQAQELIFLLTSLCNRIGEVQNNVLCGGEPDAAGSWFRKLMFYRALFNWMYWNELAVGSYIPDIVNLGDDVQVFIFNVCCLVLNMASVYLNLLALFTVEPILLGVQYGLYRVKGCNNFLYHSSGYRICRLQRAWMNFTRYKPVSVTLIVSLIFLGSRYGWKGILGWTVFPYVLRFSTLYWRGWRVL